MSDGNPENTNTLALQIKRKRIISIAVVSCAAAVLLVFAVLLSVFAAEYHRRTLPETDGSETTVAPPPPVEQTPQEKYLSAHFGIALPAFELYGRSYTEEFTEYRLEGDEYITVSGSRRVSVPAAAAAGDYVIITSKEGCVFIGRDGKTVFSTDIFLSCSGKTDTEGNVLFEDGKNYYTLRDGALVPSEPFTVSQGDRYFIGDDGVLLSVLTGEPVELPKGFTLSAWSEGYAVLENSAGKYGCYNPDSGWLFSPLFDSLEPFSEGYALFTDGNGIGIIRSDGSVVLQSGLFDYIGLCRSTAVLYGGSGWSAVFFG